MVKLKNQITFTLFSALFLFCSNSFAEDIYKKAKFSWLASPSNQVLGYRLYIGNLVDGPFPFTRFSNSDPVLNPTNGRIESEVSGLACGSNYSFVATAVTSNPVIESGISSIVEVDYSGDCSFNSMSGFKIAKQD